MRQIASPLFQRGLLRNTTQCVETLSRLGFAGSSVVLITDETVAHLHANILYAQWKKHHLPIQMISIPSGEQTKTRAMKEQLEDALFAAHMGRDSVLIAMGGGVILDLVGFVASTYCRGIGLVLIPTTLLAMCDASIGGKTGVNVPGAKNRIGTFYPADGVWIDPEVLTTLPVCHLKEGLVEMIKHGLVADCLAYRFIEEHIEKILQLDPAYLDPALQQSIAIKQRIVEEDPEEAGVRAVLNFGHTVGHAIEAESGYTISHGRAVAIGLAVEARLSREHAGLPEHDVERIDRMLGRLEFVNDVMHLTVKSLINAMQSDKKNRHGRIHCVLLEAIGKPKYVDQCFTHALSSQELEVGMRRWLHEE